MKISAKILLSYISILSLLVLIAYFGISSMSSMGDNFNRYRQLALQTNASGQVLDGMLATRILIKNYVISPSEENAILVEEKANETTMYIEELQAVVDSTAKSQMATEIHGDLDQYLLTFQEIVLLENESLRINSEILGPKGGEVATDFNALMVSARDAGNAEVVFQAGEAAREVYLAGLLVQSFLRNPTEQSYNSVINQITAVNERQQPLLDILTSNSGIELANSAFSLLGEYTEIFQQLNQNISRRNDLLSGTLDQIGPEVAAEIASLKADVKAEQDALGPQMVGLIEFETTTSLILSSIALLMGLIFSILVGRNIATPVSQMTSAMERLSSGDLDVEIPGQDKSDEIGQMATAVQIFKENAVRMKSNSSHIFGALQSTTTITEFCREAIKQITPLLNGGHGAFYTYDDKSKQLSLTGSYGYKDRKELSNKFELGQGLIGQCAMERETITLTTVPDEYIKISSGLGSAAPKAVIATPVTHQDELLGVIEVASFSDFDETAKRILDDLLTVLGLTMENIIRSERTATLLETSTAQAEALLQNEAELKASEEEMQASNEELIEKTKLLEQQTHALQESEEEARATNEELIEKTQLMEKQQDTLKEVSEENAHRAQELEESNRYKSEFLANMSHELRTPLNSLLILSKSLADNNDGDLNEDSVEAAEIIHGSGEQLLGLINDILDLSKIEAGRLDTKAEAHDIRDLMKLAERKFNHMAEEKNIDFKINIEKDVPANFVTDMPKVDQVITNLIGNAIKFTEIGNVNVDVRTVNDKGTRQLIVEVSDTGCGIAADQQNTIFEAFHQADGSSSRRFGGTGLGLSISKNLAVVLNGDISITSKEEVGSTFTLTMNEMVSGKKIHPVRESRTSKAAVKAVPTVPKHTIEIYIEDDREKVTTGSQVILVIANNKEFAMVLREDVRKRGILCMVVKDGEDALAICESHVPDGIILDEDIPGMSDIEFIEKLKSSPHTRKIPVHFITAEEKEKNTASKKNSENKEKQASKKDINSALDSFIIKNDDEKRKILVVEDDKGSAIAIKKLISADNISIDVATTGKSAKTKVTKQAYDCVILDLTLPDMDGIEVLKKMASLNNNSNELLPVIVYSGRDLELDMISEIKQYTDSIIVKGGRSPERLLDEVALFLHSVKDQKLETEQLNGTISGLDDIIKKLEGKTVLAVDDDMRNTFALSRVLREKGLNLLMAQDGLKALKQLDEHANIEAVLMDIMMPGMDGYETIGKIREEERFSDLPIIAVTAKAMKGDRQKCLQAGATSYMSKPINIELLLQELGNLIGDDT